jgi:hypothetical protein
LRRAAREAFWAVAYLATIVNKWNEKTVRSLFLKEVASQQHFLINTY